MTKKTLGWVLAAAFGASSCATSFTGSPYVEEGRAGCEKKCRAAGMEVVGLVYMGEYSDACVCGVPGRAASNTRILHQASAAVAGAGAGVVMQMRRQANQGQNY